MEENISHVIEMAGMVLLFVFALSTGIFLYSKLMNSAEALINVNEYNRIGTGTSTSAVEDDIIRQTDFSEVFFSIVDLARNFMQYGMVDNKIKIVTSDYTLEIGCEIKEEKDSDNNVIKVGYLNITKDGLKVYGSPHKIFTDESSSVDYEFLNDLKRNYFLNDIKDYNFNFSFDDDILIYKIVEVPTDT